MTVIRVALRERSYPICVADSYRRLPQILRRLRLGPVIVIVSHRRLLARFGVELRRILQRAGLTVMTLTVPESERAKSSLVAQRLLTQLARRTTMRVPVLAAFGGGVVGDLTGFVAAVFRRGVPYVQLPTTLLAQVDSSIGGKVGIDLPEAKNAVGAFYQPRVVFDHLGLLRTLPLRQRRSGLAEIIKYAVMADAVLFRLLERHGKACLAGDPHLDRVMVERCARIKARIVSRDERETHGLRTHLNLGHTLGHALEAATGYRRLTHGEAIAIGLAYVSELSVTLGRMALRDHRRILRLLRTMGLPVGISGVSLRRVKQAMQYDKKFLSGTARWVLPTRIGRVVVSEDVPMDAVWDVMGRVVRPSA
jgi:3-dehydroquinate synthase